MDNLNIATAPKTGTFQMRINPDIKEQLEELYAENGLTLTDAINVFLQQSLNAGGLPFLVSPDNAEFMKKKAARMLMDKLQQSIDHADKNGWISEEEAYRILGVDE